MGRGQSRVPLRRPRPSPSAAVPLRVPAWWQPGGDRLCTWRTSEVPARGGGGGLSRSQVGIARPRPCGAGVLASPGGVGRGHGRRQAARGSRRNVNPAGSSASFSGLDETVASTRRAPPSPATSRHMKPHAGQSLNLRPAAPPCPAPFIPKLKGCSEELSPRGSLLGSRPHSKSPPRRPRDTESPRPSAGALHLGGPRAPGSASLGLNPSSPRFHREGAPLSTQAPGLETLGAWDLPSTQAGSPPSSMRTYEPW